MLQVQCLRISGEKIFHYGEKKGSGAPREHREEAKLALPLFFP